MSVVVGSSPSQLLQRAAALVPMLRDRAAAAEEARRVHSETFDALSDAGILRMMAPKRFGGSEADFQTQCDVLAEIARGCPSTSWVATILSAMAWLAGVFPDEAQEELYDGGDPRISGVFTPTGTATPVAGGFRVSGRWGYNTGGDGSRWTVVVAVLPGGEAPGVPMCTIVRSVELQRLDDWYASGMAATGSSTVLADNIFVPAHRALPLPDLIEAKFPARHNASNPYFNYPLGPVLAVNGGGTPMGTARGALEEFFERLPGRAITYTTYANKSEAPITHLQAGEAALKIDSSAAHIRLATTILDQHLGVPLSMADRVKCRAHIGYSTGLAREAVDTIFFGSGASAVQPHVRIQRLQRDIQTLANHAIMHSATAVELYGRVLCGLEPNTFVY